MSPGSLAWDPDGGGDGTGNSMIPAQVEVLRIKVSVKPKEPF